MEPFFEKEFSEDDVVNFDHFPNTRAGISIYEHSQDCSCVSFVEDAWSNRAPLVPDGLSTVARGSRYCLTATFADRVK